MPVLFEQNGFDVTVCDPTYGNYNFFCYSLMKCLPRLLQNLLYDDGKYMQPKTDENGSTNYTENGTSVPIFRNFL